MPRNARSLCAETADRDARYTHPLVGRLGFLRIVALVNTYVLLQHLAVPAWGAPDEIGPDRVTEPAGLRYQGVVATP